MTKKIIFALRIVYVCHTHDFNKKNIYIFYVFRILLNELLLPKISQF